jgi:hypothetical protein
MTDIQAANDEKFPDTELSDDMILSALKTAKIRKDGAFIQSIKNNLIKNAKIIPGIASNKENSLLLADHIKNVSVTHPIKLNTVEY